VEAKVSPAQYEKSNIVHDIVYDIVYDISYNDTDIVYDRLLWSNMFLYCLLCVWCLGGTGPFRGMGKLSKARLRSS
jgi:hypothetical protein